MQKQRKNKEAVFLKHEHAESSKASTYLKRFLILTGVYFIVNIGVVVAVLIRNTRKMKQHENANNQMEAFLLQNEDLSIKPDTQNAYITVLSSSVNIRVPKPEKESMNIGITAVLGKLNICLPPDVTVKCEGSGHLRYSQEGLEPRPVINLIIHDQLTLLRINKAE